MLIAVMIWLLKKTGWWKRFSFLRVSQWKMKQRLTRGISLLLIFESAGAPAQEQHMQYHVYYNDKRIGEMQLWRKIKDDCVYVKIASKVEARLVLKVEVLTEEESLFRNNKLVFSKVGRTVNGKEKIKKLTIAKEGGYELREGVKKSFLASPAIEYNIGMLYEKEPLTMHTVYSDNFQQFIPVVKSGVNCYRLRLPDGNYNNYFFEKGICTKVEIHQSLYTIIMVLQR